MLPGAAPAGNKSRSRARWKRVEARRQAVWERDGGICQLCGQPVGLFAMSLDHVIPRGLGGANSQDNLQAAHRACNQRKGNRLLPQFAFAKNAAYRDGTSRA